MRVDPSWSFVVNLDRVEFRMLCQSFFIIFRNLELLVCCINDSLEILEIILLSFQTPIACLANHIPNFRDFSVDVVAWKKNELNALVIRLFDLLSPYAELVSKLVPIEAVKVTLACYILLEERFRVFIRRVKFQ